MSNRSTDLLAHWIAENVRAVSASRRETESKRLAVEFSAFAKDVGLGDADLTELEEEIGVNLQSHMADALDMAVARDDGETE